MHEGSGVTRGETKARRSYAPPDVVRVRLVADQVLSIGCKASSGSLTASGNTYGCTTVVCSAAGS